MAAAEEKKEEVGTAGAADMGAPAGGGSSKLVVILSALNVVATLGMVGILLVSFKKEKSHGSVEDIALQEEHAEAGGDAHGGGHGAPDPHGGGHGGGILRKKQEFGRMVPLEQFQINLANPGANAPRFVRVNISLEVATEDTEAELTAKVPQIRNTIIDLFNSKRVTDLSSSEGRDYLKEEIKNAVNGFMVTGKVKGVFFTNFALTG